MFSDGKALSSLIAYNMISLVFSFFFFFNSLYFPNWILSEDFCRVDKSLSNSHRLLDKEGSIPWKFCNILFKKLVNFISDLFLPLKCARHIQFWLLDWGITKQCCQTEFCSYLKYCKFLLFSHSLPYLLQCKWDVIQSCTVLRNCFLLA